MMMLNLRRDAHWRRILQRSEQELIDLIQIPSIQIGIIDTPLHTLDAGKRCFRGGYFGDANTENLLFIHSVKVTCTNHASTPSGPPLVLIHGYVSASMTFYRNLVKLAHIFGTVYAVDLLGWGLSSRPRNLVFSTTNEAETFFVDSLEAWRMAQAQSDLSLETMILAGHSMGGYLTVAYTEQYSSRVPELLLMVPAGVKEDQTTPSIQGLACTSAIISKLWNWGVSIETLFRVLPLKHMVGQVFGDYMTKAERQIMTDYMHANLMLPTPPVNRIFRANSLAYHPLCHRIPKLVLGPTRISFLYAERDTWMKVEYGLAVVDSLELTVPHAIPAVYMIRDAGHALMWKHPDAFSVAVATAAGKTIPDKDTALRPIVHRPGGG